MALARTKYEPLGMRMEESELLPAEWFRETKSLLEAYWKETPWQREGDRVVARLGKGMGKYARFLRELPDTFIPMMMDQYLAALWHGKGPRLEADFPIDLDARQREARLRFGQGPWTYQAFQVLEDLGESRYRCSSEEGEVFLLYSPSLGKSLGEGSRLFLSLLLESGQSWWMSYGPILGWNGLLSGDLAFFASRVARQRYAIEGLDGVMRFDPLPFWALWHFGAKPLVHHGNRAVISTWHLGRLDKDFGTALPTSWRCQDSGKQRRWLQGEDYLARKSIYLNTKTGDALLHAHSRVDLTKILRLTGQHFIPASDRPGTCGILIEVAVKDLLGVDPELVAWERPFSTFD